MTTAAVYSDKQILKEIKDGHIIIEPYNESQLNNCSYNIAVSEYFFREKRPPFNKLKRTPEKILFNPWNESHVAKRWEQGTVEVANEENAAELSLKVGDKYILLAPFETILVATIEFTGGREHITAEIRGRSSGGRSLISVCGGAGWGDVGYINRWTLMVTNLSRFAHLVLPVGCSIAQIIFLECGHPRKSYQGKYQSGVDHNKDVDVLLAEIKEKWSPAMMLPQLFKELPIEEQEPISPSSSEEDSEEEDLMNNRASLQVQKHPIATETSSEEAKKSLFFK